MFGTQLSWTQYAVANVDLDGTGLHIRCFDALRSDYGGFPSLMQPIDETVFAVFKNIFV